MRPRYTYGKKFGVSFYFAISLLMLSCTAQQCSQWQPIATALADDDRDGWFTAATNDAVALNLTSGTFSSPGDYQIIVDEVRFPIAPTLEGRFPVNITQIGSTVSLFNTTVATRAGGVQGFGATGTPFSATVRVVRHLGPIASILGTVTVPFGRTAGGLAPVTIGTPLLGTATLNFTVAVTQFADPTPQDSMGDADADGIPEVAEGRLAFRFLGTFDPRIRDIDAIIGTTSPTFTLDSLSRELLRSRFAVNGIALHLDEGMLAGRTGEGGLMNLSSTTATATGAVSPAQALAVRNANVSPGRRRFAYFTLLAGNATSGGITAFGFASGIPGNTLVMRNAAAAAPTIIPPITWYQSGVYMHELGHLLGLCHPTLSDGTGGCLAIPVGERSSAASVMGAPSEDPNIVIAGINALLRPLDYTATQWTQLRLGAGFSP